MMPFQNKKKTVFEFHCKLPNDYPFSVFRQNKVSFVGVFGHLEN